ncbi:hypothetical protein PPSIR1_15120 [Plesiocystis pacifica SIR-1]|uniref:Uncharacterized protein n=1 Tax=Plesiocystis pacifica SIR-1 TaxID=391625 RepID=A6G6F1_9BACT|nr:monovalent cation/H(+) antiporter subunit G [Plesiocystis pacifica]EDM78580.1 hypothetical protein PPSIR1_15120 [Plesiocystis pacifica SIR-1]
MGALQIVGSFFLLVGCVFALTGSVGVLRMPDFYSRLHPAGKSDTLAQGLILLGLGFFAGQQALDLFSHGDGAHDPTAQLIGLANIVLKLVLLTLLLFLTAPTATHAISKAARLDRYTNIPIDGDEGAPDPGSSTVAEIVVPGDVGPLQEATGQIFNVDDDAPAAEADAESGSADADADADAAAEAEGSDDPADAEDKEDPQ